MRSLCLFVVTPVTVLLLSGCRKPVTNVDELIERNIEAMGGRSAIEAVQGVEMQLHIVDPDFQVDATYYAVRPGKMRIDVSSGGKRVFTEAFDGTNGWEANEKGEKKPASDQGKAALRHGVELPGHIFGLHEIQRRGHRIELAGREQIDSINYYVLKVTMNDGYSTSLLVDPDSWLITRRRDFRPLHVDRDPTPTTIESRSSDFRVVNGVKFPFASQDVDLNTGKEIESATIQSIKVNPPIESSIFERS